MFNLVKFFKKEKLNKKYINKKYVEALKSKEMEKYLITEIGGNYAIIKEYNKNIVVVGKYKNMLNAKVAFVEIYKKIKGV